MSHSHSGMCHTGLQLQSELVLTGDAGELGFQGSGGSSSLVLHQLQVPQKHNTAVIITISNQVISFTFMAVCLFWTFIDKHII